MVEILAITSTEEFYNVVGGFEFSAKSLANTFNQYVDGFGPVLVRIQSFRDIPVEEYDFLWAGPDFLTLRPVAGNDTIMMPLSSIEWISVKPILPFPLFKTPSLSNLIPDGLNPQSANWSAVGGASASALPINADGLLAKPVRFDGAADWHRYRVETPVLSTVQHVVSAVFKATAPRISVYFNGDKEAAVRGPVNEALYVGDTKSGPINHESWEDMGDGFWRLTLRWTPATARVHQIGIGDDGKDGYVDIYGVGLAVAP